LRRFTAEIERVKAHFPSAKRVGLADGAESNWQFLTQHTQTQILDFYHASSYLGAVANAKYPKDKSAHKAWLEDRCHQLKHKAGAAEALYNEMVALQARKSTQKLPRHLRDKLGAAVTYRLSEIKLPKIPLEYAHLTILGDHINGSVSNIFFQSAIRKTTGKYVNRVQIKKYSSIPISNSTDLLWRRARNKGDCNTVWNKRQNCRQLAIKIHVRRNRLDNG